MGDRESNSPSRCILYWDPETWRWRSTAMCPWCGSYYVEEFLLSYVVVTDSLPNPKAGDATDYMELWQCMTCTWVGNRPAPGGPLPRDEVEVGQMQGGGP